MHQERASWYLVTFVKWYFKPLKIHSKTQTELFSTVIRSHGLKLKRPFEGFSTVTPVSLK